MYELLQRKLDKTRWELEWEANYENIEWSRVYKVLKNKLADRKALDTQWKSLTYGLCTEEKQKKMRLSNGMCKLCTIEIETVEHMFYECELVGKVWAVLDKATNATWKVNCDRLKLVIFCQVEITIV